MSLKPSLYFIALIPHEQLSRNILAFQKDFALHYESSKALKVMSHITIQNPFQRME
jgi:hypothetical protein